MKYILRCITLLAFALPYSGYATIGIAPYVAATSSGTKPSIVNSSGGTSTGPTTDVAPLPGYKAGIFIRPRLHSWRFYLQSGVLYSVYGYKEKKKEVKMGMAEVPLFLLLKFGMPCRPRFVIAGGGVAAFDKGRNMLGAGASVGIEFPRGAFISAGYQQMSRDSNTGANPGLYQYNFGVGYVINNEMGNNRGRSRRSNRYRR